MANNQQHKKSGVVYSEYTARNGNQGIIINAWNYSKSRGLVTAKVATYSGTTETKSKKGNVFLTMMAVVEYKNSGVRRVFPVLYNRTTKKVSLEEIGMVISPNGSGTTKGGKRVTGYFGTFNK